MPFRTFIKGRKTKMEAPVDIGVRSKSPGRICKDCIHKKYAWWPGKPTCEEYIDPLPSDWPLSLEWESCLFKEKKSGR